MPPASTPTQDKGKGKGSRGRDGRPVDDFEEGDILHGKVVAVQDFGIFVDIGAVKDALLPWSAVASSKKNSVQPGEVLEELRITKVDVDRQRLGVGMMMWEEDDIMPPASTPTQ